MWRSTSALALAALLASAPVCAAEDRSEALTTLILQDCGSCHGMTLRGGLGASLLPVDLADKDTEVLAAIILDGVPNTPMPPWRGLLSEPDARWIAAALKKGFPR